MWGIRIGALAMGGSASVMAIAVLLTAMSKAEAPPRELFTRRPSTVAEQPDSSSAALPQSSLNTDRANSANPLPSVTLPLLPRRPDPELLARSSESSSVDSSPSVDPSPSADSAPPLRRERMMSPRRQIHPRLLRL